MLPGPVFTAEMITSGRRRRYFVVKCAYGLLLGSLLLWSYLAHIVQSHVVGIQSISTMMNWFFSGFSVAQLAVVLLVTPVIVAGTIAGDRERRTLEDLLVAPLSGAEIVWGKFASAMVRTLNVVLVGLPVLAIAGLGGGIAPLQLAGVFLLSLGTALVVGAITMVLSVFSRRTRWVIRRAVLLLGALLLGPMLLASMVSMAAVAPSSGQAVSSVTAFTTAALEKVSNALLYVNPMEALASLLSTSTMTPAGPLPFVIGTYAVTAAVCLLAAAVSLRWSHRRMVGKGETERAERPSRRLHAGRARSWLDDYPLIAKEQLAAVHRGWRGPISGKGGKAWIMVVGIVLLILLELYIASRASRVVDEVQMTVSTVLGFASYVLMLGAVTTAARSIVGEREQKTWDALMATPLSAHSIVLQRLAAHLMAYRSSLGALAVAWCIPPLLTSGPVLRAIRGSTSSIGSYGTPMMLWCTGAALSWLATVVGLVFAIALGLYISLRSRSTRFAAVVAAAIFVFVSGGYVMLGCFISIPLAFLPRGAGELIGQVALIPCLMLHLASPQWFGSRFAEKSGVIWQFAAGMALYLAAAAMLTRIAILQFDRYAGRITARCATAPPAAADDESKSEPILAEEATP